MTKGGRYRSEVWWRVLGLMIREGKGDGWE